MNDLIETKTLNIKSCFQQHFLICAVCVCVLFDSDHTPNISIEEEEKSEIFSISSFWHDSTCKQQRVGIFLFNKYASLRLLLVLRNEDLWHRLEFYEIFKSIFTLLLPARHTSLSRHEFNVVQANRTHTDIVPKMRNKIRRKSHNRDQQWFASARKADVWGRKEIFQLFFLSLSLSTHHTLSGKCSAAPQKLVQHVHWRNEGFIYPLEWVADSKHFGRRVGGEALKYNIESMNWWVTFVRCREKMFYDNELFFLSSTYANARLTHRHWRQNRFQVLSITQSLLDTVNLLWKYFYNKLDGTREREKEKSKIIGQNKNPKSSLSEHSTPAVTRRWIYKWNMISN